VVSASSVVLSFTLEDNPDGFASVYCYDLLGEGVLSQTWQSLILVAIFLNSSFGILSET
jgi:hypothetical protein